MDRRFVARVAAPLALLLAATVLVLLVRSALDEPETARPATTALPATTTAETQTGSEPAPAARYYVVKSGDTLEAIAARHDTSVERLLELNPDVDPVALTIGQRIRVG
jgi:LysM repeat protein